MKAQFTHLAPFDKPLVLWPRDKGLRTGPSIKLRDIVLILLLLTAFALRLYRLDHQELWGDEAHSACVSKLPLTSTVSPCTETNPPLYHLLHYFWVRLAGSSVFALRFLSLVLGLLTVPLVYRLARLGFGVLVGLLAALLCAISPFQVSIPKKLACMLWRPFPSPSRCFSWPGSCPAKFARGHFFRRARGGILRPTSASSVEPSTDPPRAPFARAWTVSSAEPLKTLAPALLACESLTS